MAQWLTRIQVEGECVQRANDFAVANQAVGQGAVFVGAGCLSREDAAVASPKDGNHLEADQKLPAFSHRNPDGRSEIDNESCWCGGGHGTDPPVSTVCTGTKASAN